MADGNIMALLFGAATTDRVSIPGAASINDITTLTMCAWIYPTAVTGGRIWSKGSTAQKRLNQDAGGALSTTITRTSDSSFVSTTLLVLNTWQFVVVTYSEAAGVRGYLGNLSKPVEEMSYSSTVVGSGATGTESAGAMNWGNRQGSNSAWTSGAIEVGAYFNRVLSLTEMRLMQEYMRLRTPKGLPGCVSLHKLGYFEGTGVQYDLSGQNNHGTVTGATLVSFG